VSLTLFVDVCLLRSELKDSGYGRKASRTLHHSLKASGHNVRGVLGRVAMVMHKHNAIY